MRRRKVKTTEAYGAVLIFLLTLLKSDEEFTLGNGSAGAGTPSAVQRGAQPSRGWKMMRRSAGTTDLTHSVCSSNRRATSARFSGF